MNLPPEYLALAPDLADLDAEELDELEGHVAYWLALEAPEPGTAAWVADAVAANPGIWTAALCRAMHGLPETEESVVYCGRCEEYANPRKRARARRYAAMPTLPGFEAPYQLHPRCDRGLTWLRHQLYVMATVRREAGAVIPDCRQQRGWDFGTRLYVEPEADHGD
jgi:hypothetical protein